MPKSWRHRLTAIVGLLAVLFVLMVGYGVLTPAPTLGAYPTENDPATNYNAYVDEHVQVAGTVIETDPVVIAAEYDQYTQGTRRKGTIELTITNIDEPVERGQFVQVYGTATGDRAIIAANVVVVPAGNFRYMYIVSALAGLWVLGRLVRGWRIDWETGAVTRRKDPLTIETITTRFIAEAD
ncbi:hypothetical protein [Natronomonas sp. EA1]|uniref:hypothetical protein n=1 Tax=Natronomonas sp. EA1 TaxID=3421655 RepID=UPI003EBCD107